MGRPTVPAGAPGEAPPRLLQPLGLQASIPGLVVAASLVSVAPSPHGFSSVSMCLFCVLQGRIVGFRATLIQVTSFQNALLLICKDLVFKSSPVLRSSRPRAEVPPEAPGEGPPRLFQPLVAPGVRPWAGGRLPPSPRGFSSVPVALSLVRPQLLLRMSVGLSEVM